MLYFFCPWCCIDEPLTAGLIFMWKGLTFTRQVLVNHSAIDTVHQYVSPPTLPLRVSPKGQDMWRKNTALPHRLGPINADREKQSFFITSEMFRQRLTQSFLHRSTVLSGYRSDVALSPRGWRGRATEASINNAEGFSKCVFFPKRRMCYQAAFICYFFILFSLKLWEDWEGNSSVLT